MYSRGWCEQTSEFYANCYTPKIRVIRGMHGVHVDVCVHSYSLRNVQRGAHNSAWKNVNRGVYGCL